jgi:SpoVK/Ycf46/Vps4 family AAA+-type ATPase
MSDKHDLELLIHGHVPIINIETFEERRAITQLVELATRTFLPIFRWTATEGLQRMDIDLGTQKHVSEPQDLLRHIKSSKLQALYLLVDFTPYLNDPMNIRLVKEIAMHFEGDKGKLVFISHRLELPDNLSRLSASFHLRLPGSDELHALIQQEARAWQAQSKSRVRTDRDTLDRLTRNLSGLSFNDARRLVRSAIIDDGAITEADLPEVMRAKYGLLNRDEILAFEYETARFSEVGGMNRLKNWLIQRQPAFQGDKDLPRGLDRPRGMLLLGVQGCGKSLAARAVSGIWGIPLLRLDFGRLYNKYVGETERNMRQALHTAEIMAPCVLWIDELEKGISAGNDDEGTSKRLLGTLLTWLAENQHAVFIVATANQIDALPPELIRKGRLDEIFFVDLPNEDIRRQIFHIHFDKREVATGELDVALLAKASEGFSGSEIEQAVVSAMYRCHAAQQPVDTESVLQEIQQTRPLSVVMSEQVSRLRQWASERTVAVD